MSSEGRGPNDGAWAGRSDQDLEAEVSRLERELLPLQAEIDARRREIEAVRTELRRRARDARLQSRKGVRAELASGGMPTLEEVISGADERFAGASFDALQFLRESATEVRLGYASAARQGMSFTDGAAVEDVYDIGGAHRLWDLGWEPGTPAARGVRIYPVGSRAERVVPVEEIHVRGSQGA